MQRYSNTITTAAGRAIVGAQIAVKTTAGALATIYADDGITTKANPVLSGAAGYFEFYAVPGDYSLTISGAGITANVVSVTLAEPQAVVIPAVPSNSALLVYDASGNVAGIAGPGGKRLSIGSTVIAASSTPVEIYGVVNQAEKMFATIPLPANAVQPDSALRLTGLVNFGLPGSSTNQVYIYIGAALVAQFSAQASSINGSIEFETYLRVSPDLQNITTQSSYIGRNNTANGVAFGALAGNVYSAAVDLTADQVMVIKMRPQYGDMARLDGFTLENIAAVSGPTGTYAPVNAVAFWGDSLTQGTGGTPYPQQFQQTTPDAGRPVFNGGIGGQTAAQIAARVLRDKVRGKYWTCVFWLGRNDVGSPDLAAAVLPQIRTCVANLSHSRFVILGITNATTENNASAMGLSISAANAAIAAAFPNNFIDIRSVLATDPGGIIPASLLYDTTHLNTAGYNIVRQKVSDFLAAKGW